MSSVSFETVDAGADELARAIEATPFSDDLKARLWKELLGSPDAFPSGPDGVFDIGYEAAYPTSEGAERHRWAIPFRLGRRGEILLAAFRALGSEAATPEFDHAYNSVAA